MFDRDRLHAINAEQLVTRTDLILSGGISKRRPSRPALAYVAVAERTVLVRPAVQRTPWRAMLFGAMFGVAVGAVAVVHIARHDAPVPAIAAHAR